MLLEVPGVQLGKQVQIPALVFAGDTRVRFEIEDGRSLGPQRCAAELSR
jgi:hypothetical protein